MIAVAVHGGAGRAARDRPPGDPEACAALAQAVTAARDLLTDGASALDAVQRAVELLEACPLFNAGTGSVLTAAGDVEMDAALMDGASRRSGAVAAVRTPRHAVALARAVLDRSPHAMLAGEGADAFAAAHGIEQVPAGHHVTRRSAAPSPGTVGAVALDLRGDLAAATSTGGMRGQLPGRVGDSPVVGAGTFAGPICAVSASGDGEALLRAAAAHDVAARMAYAGATVGDAANAVVTGIATDAALIALDARGDLAMPFNTEVFHRGWLGDDGGIRTAIGS